MSVMLVVRVGIAGWEVHVGNAGRTLRKDTLSRRSDRESFCIPIHHFTRAVEELKWWEEVLRVGGGKTWFVGSDGLCSIWKWMEEVGAELPPGVLEFATDASKWGG
eukprot:2443565-Rhodomonas_salina.1